MDDLRPGGDRPALQGGDRVVGVHAAGSPVMQHDRVEPETGPALRSRAW